ncbi:MAG TPA: hypothetical protein VFJ80_02090 [Candidatus Limnocylindrales bacterium]|jgi:hypothetical protein|nr:hypothetical protein [Candidatus Limnocylindrales bacterium]
MDIDDDALEEFARRMGAPNWRKDRTMLADPIIRALADKLGVDLTDAEIATHRALVSMIATMRASRLLGRYGWTVSDSQLTGEIYATAVAMVENGADASTIDEYMTAAWSDEQRIRRSFGPMFQLVPPGDEAFEIMKARQRLLNQAVDHHERGEYAASILIVLTQIDGLAFDVRGRGRGAFQGATADTFLDDVTVAGLPDNLRTVWQIMTRHQRTSTAAGELSRHAILHGREVAFASKTNSAKAFALLRSIIEWLQPQAAATRR